jgi:hypothetical protein
MPRGPQNLFDRVQKDGRKFLAALQAEIRDRESELEGMREQATRWLAAVNGGAPAKRGPGRLPKASATTRRRAAKPKRSSPAVDWDAILAKLPRAFTSADLEKATPSLNDHRQARNIALARWSRTRAVKKSAPGKYRKLAKG